MRSRIAILGLVTVLLSACSGPLIHPEATTSPAVEQAVAAAIPPGPEGTRTNGSPPAVPPTASPASPTPAAIVTPTPVMTPHAASNSGAPQPAAPPPSAEQHEIGFHATGLFNDGALAVTFSDLAEDSRCPLDVDCVWSGMVTVLLTVAAEGQPAETITMGGFSTSTGAIQKAIPDQTGPATVEYAGSTLHLIAVRPYPVHAAQPTPSEEYSVMIAVTPSEAR